MTSNRAVHNRDCRDVIAVAPPSHEDTLALAAVFDEARSGAGRDIVTGAEDFIAQRPGSPYTPSLRNHLIHHIFG